MKMQRKVNAGPPISREANRLATRSTKQICSPGERDARAKTSSNVRDRKAQYLRKERENKCVTSRGMRRSMDSDACRWLGHARTISRPESGTLQANSNLVNKLSPRGGKKPECIKVKDDETTDNKSSEEEPPMPQSCDFKPAVQSVVPIARFVEQKQNNETDTSTAEEVGTKYLRLLEKYDQQSRLVQVLEEQLSGLRVLIEECTGENQHLVGLLKEKEERETSLLTELENAKKEAAKVKEERERFSEERMIHEQIVKRLNKKLSKYKETLRQKPGGEIHVGTTAAEYYKRMSEKHLKESSRLAEQLICLRSDLEKQNVEIIRQHRQNSSSTSSCCTDILALWGEERTPRDRDVFTKSLCSTNRNARTSMGRYSGQREESPFSSVQIEKVTGTPQSANKELESSSKSRKGKEPPNRPYNFPTHSHTFK